MQRNFIYILYLLSFVLLFSCSKKNHGTKKQTIVMNANINGRPWSSNQCSVTLADSNTLRITIAVDSGNTNINLYLYNYIGTGVYPLANLNNIADSPNRAYFTEKSGTGKNLVHNANGGQIIVQNNYLFGESQTGIEGYFNFYTDTVNVTNGYFNVILSLN